MKNWKMLPADAVCMMAGRVLVPTCRFEADIVRRKHKTIFETQVMRHRVRGFHIRAECMCT